MRWARAWKERAKVWREMARRGEARVDHQKANMDEIGRGWVAALQRIAELEKALSEALASRSAP